MRIAVAGKGGSGKTTIAATAARVLGRSGRPVVTVDADSNPNLAVALGAGPATPRCLPTSLLSRRLDGPALTQPLATVIAEHGAAAPDGISLLLMGMPAHAGEGCLCSAHATVRGLLADAGEARDWITIVDMEASPEHLSRSTAEHVDVLVLVAEPYYRSLETVRRLAALAADLPIPRVVVVGNKIRSAEDGEAIREFCERHDLEWLGDVPWSDAITRADREQIPVVDAEGAQEVVGAVQELVGRLDLWARAP